MAKKSVLKKILGFFNLTTKNDIEIKYIYPSKTDLKTGKSTGKPVDFSSVVEKYMDEFLKNNYEDSASVSNRFNRYNDLDFMVKNDGYLNTAVEKYAYEATQADVQNNIIDIKAKAEVKTWITNFLDKIGINETLIQDAVYNLALFADSFLVHDLSEDFGIVKVTPVSPYNVKDRLEFSATKMAENMAQQKSVLYQMTSNNKAMERLAQVVLDEKETENLSDYFRNYLFGFLLGENEELALPPWMVTHFRRFTTQSEYFPFGRPLLINSLGLFKQLQSAKVLQNAMRANSFPYMIWEVETGEKTNVSDKWGAVAEFKEMYQNLGLSQTDKENNVGNFIFMPKDLATLKIEDPRIEIGKIADIENLEQNMIASTGIPPTALLQGTSTFGNSGQALVQQDKNFGRKVYSLQTAFLEGIVSLIKLQMVLTGAYDHNEVDFEVTMFFPIEEASSDKSRASSDSVRLANDILTNLGTALGLDRGEALPTDIVQQVFSKYSFLEPSEVQKWVKSVEKQRGKIEEKKVIQEKKKKFAERVQRLTEQEYYDAYFNAKNSNYFREGVISNFHYLTSKSINNDNKNYLEILQEGVKIKRLLEKENLEE